MVQDIINDIKKELRANMNGVASAHARQTEDYRVNWGVELPRVEKIADEIAKNEAALQEVEGKRELAQALWNESVRECKILACMLMPTEAFAEEVCDIWAESIRTDEIATLFCLYLMPRLPYASVKAFLWISSDKELYQLCGFHILSRIFMAKREPNERGINEFIDQAVAALQGNNIAVRKAAHSSIQRFAELGLVYERLAKSALKRANLEIL